ncbi:hypothetical protein GLOIN_2v1673942 [Rhizophagus irregularis DAOM 181602=DAOM 197198]|nr:hypothetical protein GLOIN_2v1673942 [Rhizophagus irregularis DAOM 181602=DAOM 197198]
MLLASLGDKAELEGRGGERNRTFFAIMLSMLGNTGISFMLIKQIGFKTASEIGNENVGEHYNIEAFLEFCHQIMNMSTSSGLFEKHNCTVTKNSMDEDYVANAQTADVGKDGFSSSPQQNIWRKYFDLLPKKFCCPTVPSHIASSGNVDVSMHAPSNKDNGDNLFLETYESYTEKARMTSSGDAKRLVIHFHTADIKITLWPTSRNSKTLLLAASFQDPMRKYNKPALYMTMLIQSHDLLTNGPFTASPPVSESLCDINLALLTCELGAKAINIPLSLNSYKPKRWAYVTFNSQETMDAALEQTERFNVNQPRHSNSNANARSRSHSRSKSRDRSASTLRRDNNNKTNSNNINNRNTPNPNSTQHTWQHSKECSVSFSSSFRSIAHLLPCQTPNSALSTDDAANILNLLRELQCEVANFHKRISALELADQRMTRIKSHLGLNPIPTIIKPELDLMQEDATISHVPLNIHPSAKSSSPLKVF